MARARIIVKVLAAMAVACSAPITAETAPVSEPIEVTATIRDANTELEISWAVVHKGSKPLLVLTRPLQHDDTPSKHSIYVSRADDGEIELSLRVFSVPDGVNPTVLDRIGAVPLAPGKRLEGRAVVPLPLSTNTPYQDRASSLPKAQRARVCIGVLEADAKFPVSSQSEEMVATYHERAVASQQRVACSPSVTLPGR
jgi:hypothetical protein